MQWTNDVAQGIYMAMLQMSTRVWTFGCTGIYPFPVPADTYFFTPGFYFSQAGFIKIDLIDVRGNFMPVIMLHITHASRGY
jgi:hypothetical protein